MKLRNKKTGEIIDSKDLLTDEVIKDLFSKDFKYFDSKLANIQRMWEDYEEPKEYWYIDDAGVLQIDQVLASEINMRKSIGNYFDTREEAEKAVEKLKAWKRLKDKGCRFILDDHFAVKFVGPDATKIISAEEQKSLSDDYKLLFRGKE